MFVWLDVETAGNTSPAVQDLVKHTHSALTYDLAHRIFDSPDDGLIQSETCTASNRKWSLITRILCILLVYIYIVGWCTVHTTANSRLVLRISDWNDSASVLAYSLFADCPLEVSEANPPPLLSVRKQQCDLTLGKLTYCAPENLVLFWKDLPNGSQLLSCTVISSTLVTQPLEGIILHRCLPVLTWHCKVRVSFLKYKYIYIYIYIYFCPLGGGSKAVSHVADLRGMSKNPGFTWKSKSQAKLTGHFSPM